MELKETNLYELTKDMDMILVNELGAKLLYDDYTQVYHTIDLDYFEYDDIYEYMMELDVYQFFIVTERDFEKLLKYKGVLCYYNSDYDIYIWCNDIVFGMSWELITMKLNE